MDIHSLFASKKRFKPDAEAVAGALAGTSSDQQALVKSLDEESKALLKRNLVNSYME